MRQSMQFLGMILIWWVPSFLLALLCFSLPRASCGSETCAPTMPEVITAAMSLSTFIFGILQVVSLL
jgi:hypothetical protein